jgi:hypothetical protein
MILTISSPPGNSVAYRSIASANLRSIGSSSRLPTVAACAGRARLNDYNALSSAGVW